jgi:hypothetical protein
MELRKICATTCHVAHFWD